MHRNFNKQNRKLQTYPQSTKKDGVKKKYVATLLINIY